MGIAPLQWPEFYHRATKVQRFLADMPIVGMYFRIRKVFRRELKNRTYNALDSWENNPGKLKCISIVSPLIKDYFHWPNCYFIPDDPCEILFWRPQVGYDDLSGQEFASVLIDEFSLPEDFFEDYNKLTYSQFIEKIIKHIEG